MEVKIDGFENEYVINDRCEIINLVTKKVKKQILNKGLGYYQVQLWKNNTFECLYVHRIFAKAFLPNPDSKPTVNHKNGDRTDNRIENLEWATYPENVSHAFRVLNRSRAKGDNIGCSKLNKDTVLVIREEFAVGGVTFADLGRKYGIAATNVSQIIKRRHWNHI